MLAGHGQKLKTFDSVGGSGLPWSLGPTYLLGIYYVCNLGLQKQMSLSECKRAQNVFTILVPTLQALKGLHCCWGQSVWNNELGKRAGSVYN